METKLIKKVGIVAALAYVAFWAYNNIFKATDRLLFGSISFGSFRNGNLVLKMPISNLGQLPLKMSGMTGQLILLNQYNVGEVSVNTSYTFAPNSTETLEVLVAPNWVTLASIVGAAAVTAIKSGMYGEVFAQFQPKIKGKLFTPAFTQEFEEQIA